MPIPCFVVTWGERGVGLKGEGMGGGGLTSIQRFLPAGADSNTHCFCFRDTCLRYSDIYLCCVLLPVGVTVISVCVIA